MGTTEIMKPQQFYSPLGRTFTEFLRVERRRVVEALGDRAFAEMAKRNIRRTRAQGYHQESTTYYGRVQVAFGKFLPQVKAGSKVLEMGTSLGLTTIELATVYHDSEVTGLELDGQIKLHADFIIEEAKRDPRYLLNYVRDDVRDKVRLPSELRFPKHILVGDAFNSPFLDGSFDGVFCLNNLSFTAIEMDSQTAKERFREVCRHVSEGGHLFIGEGSAEPIIAASLKRQNGKFEVLVAKSEGPVSDVTLAHILWNCGIRSCRPSRNVNWILREFAKREETP